MGKRKVYRWLFLSRVHFWGGKSYTGYFARLYSSLPNSTKWVCVQYGDLFSRLQDVNLKEVQYIETLDQIAWPDDLERIEIAEDYEGEYDEID